MLELPTAIPDVEVLLALEPEELAGKMLFLLRARADHRMFHVGTLGASSGTTTLPSPAQRGAGQSIRGDSYEARRNPTQEVALEVKPMSRLSDRRHTCAVPASPTSLVLPSPHEVPLSFMQEANSRCRSLSNIQSIDTLQSMIVRNAKFLF